MKSSITAAVLTIGVAAPAAYTEAVRHPLNVPLGMLLGIDPAVCASRAKGPADQKAFFKLAAVQNELKPFGHLPSEETEDASSAGQPPLWTNLGTLSYPVTTDKPRAQHYFDQGIRLAYGFNHDEAARAFRAAQQIDPDCAMCYWGEALVLGPNINMPMDQNANVPAIEAIRKAMARAGSARPNEQALIRALTSRYSDRSNADRKALDAAYAEAMENVAERFPDDATIAVLYAEALMNLSPWDYWEAGGVQPKGKTGRLVQTLERALALNPDHPGAIHYYIHTVEASADPKRAEAHAERLADLMPGAGHLVHMPSHIYYRVGRYKDSLAANKQAVAVDEAYLAQRKPAGVYPLAYYPHNVHFVLVSAQMSGDGATVIDAANKLSGLISEQTAREYPATQPIRVAPIFAHAQFSAPDDILALSAPSDDLPYVKGLWHYARGVAFVGKNELSHAQQELEAINRLRQSGDFSSLAEANIPAQDVLHIASDVVAARIAQAKGKLEDAVRLFKSAAETEQQLSYMEPAYWYYPVTQSLGAVLLQKGDLDAAESAFRASLTRVPNNGWSLYGLAQVHRKQGNLRQAMAAEELLKEAWGGNPEQLSVEKL